MIFAKTRKRIWYWRKERWRKARLKFPSPAELRFITIMGGWSITFNFWRHRKTGFPRAIVFFGRYLKREYCERERRFGAYYADFSFETSYTKKIIEIDGASYHRTNKLNIVYEQERDDYLRRRGWSVKRIPARRLWNEPTKVKREVIAFLGK